MAVKAGVAREIITPPVGVELAGYGFGPSVGVLEDLEAQILYLEDGQTRVVMITTDLLMHGSEFVKAVRAGVERRLAVPAGHVMISASHTHSAPTTRSLRQWGRVDAAYLRDLETRLVDGAVTAQGRAQRARVGMGIGQVETIAENRRSGHDAVDAGVPVLRFDDEAGHPSAVLFGYGCHPVSLHSYRNLISPDYPGYARDVVCCVMGDEAVPMFTLGPAGDVNPAGYVGGKTSPARARQIGSILGCEVAKVALDPAYEVGPSLRASRTIVQLPVTSLPPLSELEPMADRWRGEVDRMRAEDRPWVQISEAEIRRDWARDAIRERKRGKLRESVPCELQAFRLGRAAIVALPLEVFVETGLAIKASSPADLTLVVTNANGGVGYLPRADAYAGRDYTNPQGLAPKVYGLYALSPDAEPLIRWSVSELVHALFDGGACEDSVG